MKEEEEGGEENVLAYPSNSLSRAVKTVRGC